jgi:periplasmic protein CpxP/Spy
MKRSIRNLATGAALVAALSFAPASASAFMGGDGGSAVRQHFKELAAELGLSAQQRQGIRAILKSDRERFQPLVKQLKIERRNLRSLIQADTIDEAAIRAQSAKVAAIQANLAVLRAQVGRQVRALLAPEQLEKLRELQAKRDARLDATGARVMEWIGGTE